jgi:hypothetical protein
MSCTGWWQALTEVFIELNVILRNAIVAYLAGVPILSHDKIFEAGHDVRVQQRNQTVNDDIK